jgi:hypothetical protein
VVDIEREKLVERMEAYLDPDVSDEEMADEGMVLRPRAKARLDVCC